MRKFSECKEGILRWCVECAQMYNSRTSMKLPPKMQAYKELYREGHERVLQVRDRHVHYDGRVQDRILKSVVFTQFKAFYVEELGDRERVPSRANVLKQLDRLLTSHREDGRQFYTGITEHD